MAAMLTWATPAPIQYGTALGVAQLTATSDSPGVFIYSPSAGTILSAGVNQILTATFYPSDGTAHIPISTTITVTKINPVLNWDPITPITVNTPLSSTQLNATSSAPGSFVYTPVSGTILLVGSHPLDAVFVPTDTNNYNTASIPNTIIVNDVLESITMIPVVASLLVGSSQQVVLSGSFLSGVIQDLTALVTCVTSGPGISVLNGLITAIDVGSYTLTFSYLGASIVYPVQINQKPIVAIDAVNPVFYKSHLLQELLNYFDRNDIRVRENPFTIDAQLLNLLAVGVEQIQLKLARESKINLESPCNIDNGGVYYGFTSAQPFLTEVSTVTGIINGTQTVFTEFDDTLPVPSELSISNNTYQLSNPILMSFIGTGDLINESIGVLPYPEKLNFFVSGIPSTLPNIDVAITGYKYPKPLWLADQQLYTEVVTINNIGLFSTINKWAEVTGICVRGLPVNLNIDCYAHMFTIPYKADLDRPVTTASQRGSKYSRYWLNKPATSDVQELKVETPMSGFDPIQSYKTSLGLLDLTIEPNTYGMYAINSSKLLYFDRREAMPNGTNAMALTVDPLVGINIQRDFSDQTGFVTVIITPVLYPSSTKLLQYRIYFQDPTGNKTVVTFDGSWLSYTPNNGWRNILPTSFSIMLPASGNYIFTIQSQDTAGNLTTDSYLYNYLSLNALASLDITSLGTVKGICFDSNDLLWIWDGTTASQIDLLYNSYSADVDSNILYLTRDVQGVSVS